MKILFICTHNRCRSILAEAIANHTGRGRLTAASAGSEPAGEVHPSTLEALAENGIPVTGLHSKSWKELTDFAPDVVITVCNSTTGEACPLWMESVPIVHWGLADPSAMIGSQEEVMAAFQRTIDTIGGRIARLVDLLEENPRQASILEALDALSEHQAAGET